VRTNAPIATERDHVDETPPGASVGAADRAQ